MDKRISSTSYRAYADVPRRAPHLTIGQLARAGGVTVDTLRFYEREGLLPRPARARNNYRYYPPEAVHWVAFIRRAKQLGFTLDDIRKLRANFAGEVDRCTSSREVAETRSEELALKVLSLQGSMARLRDILEQCTGNDPVGTCPLLVALHREDAVSD